MVLWGITFFWSRRDVIWFEKFAHGLLSRTPLFRRSSDRMMNVIQGWPKCREKNPMDFLKCFKKLLVPPTVGLQEIFEEIVLAPPTHVFNTGTLVVGEIQLQWETGLEPQAIDSVKAVKNVFLVITARRSGLAAASPTFRGLQKSSCEVSRVSLPRHYPGGTSKVEIQSTKKLV